MVVVATRLGPGGYPVGASVVTYNTGTDISESAGAVDTVDSAATLPATIAETTTAVDTESSAAVFASVVSESMIGVDTTSSLIVFSNSVSESVTSADTSSSLAVLLATLAETVASDDTLSAGGTFSSDVSETATSDDTTSSEGPPPPITGPPRTIIVLDAAFGSVQVLRTYPIPITQQGIVGTTTALLVGVGTALDPSLPLRMSLTKPDGSPLVVDAPRVYVGRPVANTGRGIFREREYVVCSLTAAQVDQSGWWSCSVSQGVFASATQQFYIRPASVLH